MELKEFLKNNPLISASDLSKEMFPNVKYPTQTLSNKLNEVQNKSGKQRITEANDKKAKEILKTLSDNIQYFIKPNQ